MIKWFKTVGLIGLSGGCLMACAQEGPSKETPVVQETIKESEQRLSVMTTFYPMYAFTKEVAGDRADVAMLLDQQQDAHTFEPSAQDIARVSESDVLVYSSDEMEFWVPAMLETLEVDDLIVVEADEGIEAMYADDHEAAEIVSHDDHDHAHAHDSHAHHDDQAMADKLKGVQGHYHTGDVATLQVVIPEATEVIWETVDLSGEHTYRMAVDEVFEYSVAHGTVQVTARAIDATGNILDTLQITLHVDDHEVKDPHTWLDPVYAQAQVDTIKDALIQADPQGEAIYEKNAEAFKQQLKAVHEQYDDELSDATARNFVVQHGAFGHLADRYRLNQVAIGGLSTEVEPSLSRMAEVEQLVRQYDVPVIYYQKGSNSEIAQTIASETNTTIAELYDLEQLPDDVQAWGWGYTDVMTFNLEQLKKSIQ